MSLSYLSLATNTVTVFGGLLLIISHCFPELSHWTFGKTVVLPLCPTPQTLCHYRQLLRSIPLLFKPEFVCFGVNCILPGQSHWSISSSPSPLVFCTGYKLCYVLWWEMAQKQVNVLLCEGQCVFLSLSIPCVCYGWCSHCVFGVSCCVTPFLTTELWLVPLRCDGWCDY